jgi:hypothetical protein
MRVGMAEAIGVDTNMTAENIEVLVNVVNEGCLRWGINRAVRAPCG